MFLINVHKSQLRKRREKSRNSLKQQSTFDSSHRLLSLGASTSCHTAATAPTCSSAISPMDSTKASLPIYQVWPAQCPLFITTFLIQVSHICLLIHWLDRLWQWLKEHVRLASPCLPFYLNRSKYALITTWLVLPAVCQQFVRNLLRTGRSP